MYYELIECLAESLRLQHPHQNKTGIGTQSWINLKRILGIDNALIELLVSFHSLVKHTEFFGYVVYIGVGLEGLSPNRGLE